MDSHEQFFKEQIEVMHKAREAKEDDWQRSKEFEKFYKCQEKEMEEFMEEREKLIKLHQEKTVELKRKQLSEEVDLEKEFDDALN